MARKQRGFRPLDDGSVGRITFHGAAGEVTGSCYLIETAASRVLVECGLFQGGRDEEARNRRPFPFDPAGLDAVVLTHAHIDHSGRLPALVRDGFAGPVHVTVPSLDLLRIMLPDSAHIHEQDAERASRRSLRRGRRPVAPLYTSEDAERALDRLVVHPWLETLEATPDVRIRFRRAGHILGAASVELWIDREGASRKIVFSGDVGRVREPLLLPPDPPGDADLVLLESTYGDRDHKKPEDSLDELARILDSARTSGANVIVPAFAVGRTQEILYALAGLERTGRIAPRPVYLDSPMAIRVTDVHARHADSFSEDVRARLAAGRENVEPSQLRLCRTPEESMALNHARGVVIIAASGMCDAGRVVHHLKHNLWRPDAHVVIIGFQARGTIGRALVDGARAVRILGEPIAVKASIHTLGAFSAHAGQSELASWVAAMLRSGARLALVHGEPEKRDALAKRLQPQARTPILLPDLGDVASIRRRGEPVVLERPPQRSPPGERAGHGAGQPSGSSRTPRRGPRGAGSGPGSAPATW